MMLHTGRKFINYIVIRKIMIEMESHTCYNITNFESRTS